MADYLSRLAAPVVPQKTEGLGELKVRTLEEKDVRCFVLRSATQRPDLWVARLDEDQRDE
mgnify:CR=1 FL=1